MSDLLQMYLFHLHVVVSIVAIAGLCMLYYWATRNLPPDRLKRWAIITLFVGGIGVIVTIPFCLIGSTLAMVH